MKMVFMFPGQGTQFLGMGYDLFCEYDFVREIFDAADETAKNNISKLCFNGPMERLTETINLQPAVTAVNLACLSVVEKEGLKCDIAMGHSLGEYSALRAAKVFSLSDTMRVVFTRGLLMDRESIRYNGVMSALIGIKLKDVKSIIEERRSEGIVSIANHNSKDQVVISGTHEGVNEVAMIAKKMTARVIPLRVSGAWHSDLMKGVEGEFLSFLDTIEFQVPSCDIIHNADCDMTGCGIGEIKRLLIRQICRPVLWYDSVCRLISEGIDIFVEIGPGRVLTGLLKKTLPPGYRCKIFNVADIKSLDFFLRSVT